MTSWIHVLVGKRLGGPLWRSHPGGSWARVRVAGGWIESDGFHQSDGMQPWIEVGRILGEVHWWRGRRPFVRVGEDGTLWTLKMRNEKSLRCSMTYSQKPMVLIEVTPMVLIGASTCQCTRIKFRRLQLQNSPISLCLHLLYCPPHT